MKKILNKQSFSYKGLEITAEDFLIAKEYSTTTARVERVWEVNGHSAFTYKVDNTVYLAYINNSGDRVILKDFNPETGFYIAYETELDIIRNAGFIYQHDVR